MKNKKVKIGFDQVAANNHLALCYEKLNILNQAVKSFKSKLETEPKDLQQFEKGFFDYAVSIVKERHPEALNFGLTDALYLKMYGYDFTDLQNLDKTYKANIGDVKFEGEKFVENVADFNIYASNEIEIERLNDINQLIDVMTSFHSKYFQNTGITIQKATFLGKYIIMDETYTKLIANPYFIKS